MVALLDSGTPALLDSTRWRAMMDRDTRDTGPFVIGVTSTGVYCVPGCPAKRPLRKNVHFFDTPADAREAGLRACKRCHPDRARLTRRPVRITLSRSKSELNSDGR